MVKKIRIGIIGAGEIADLHAIGYRASTNAQLVAVADVKRALAETKKAQYGAQESYGSYEDLLRDERIDAVDVCIPNIYHAPAAIAAAEAGKHVLVEKPMATTLRDCDEMIAAAKRNGVKLMVGHNQLFFPPHNEAKRLIEAEIGKSLILVTRLHSGFPFFGWRADPKVCGGGFLLEACVHRFYLSRYLMGEIKRVSCMTAKTSLNLLSEDIALVSMEFEKGSHGSLSANLGGPFPLWDDRTEIVGSEGLVIINGVEDQIMSGPPLLFYKDGQWRVYCKAKFPEYRKLTTHEIEADWPKTFTYLTRHFVDCIVNDKAPMVTGEDGRRVIQIILACYESAEKGTAIHI